MASTESKADAAADAQVERLHCEQASKAVRRGTSRLRRAQPLSACMRRRIMPSPDAICPTCPSAAASSDTGRDIMQSQDAICTPSGTIRPPLVGYGEEHNARYRRAHYLEVVSVCGRFTRFEDGPYLYKSKGCYMADASAYDDWNRHYRERCPLTRFVVDDSKPKSRRSSGTPSRAYPVPADADVDGASKWILAHAQSRAYPVPADADRGRDHDRYPSGIMGTKNLWFWRPKDPDMLQSCHRVWVRDMWKWAVDQLCFDKRYLSFFVTYMDHPPVYTSPEFAVDMLRCWINLSDIEYVQWLAEFRCARWDDVVLALDAAAKSSPSPSIWPPRNGWDPYGRCRTTMDGPDSIPPPPLPDMTPDWFESLARRMHPAPEAPLHSSGKRGMLASIACALWRS